MALPSAGNFASGDKFQDGYKNGFTVAVATTTTLSVSAGSLINSNNLSNAFTTTALVMNAAVVGANGIDVGALTANKMYAVHIIWNSLKSDTSLASNSLSTPAVLLSLSATAPVLPVGYDSFRRIGWAVTDGSSLFRNLYASGSGNRVEYSFDTPVSVLSAGAATTQTSVSLDQLVPAIANTPIKLAAAFTPGAASRTLTVYPSGSTGTSQEIVTGQVTSVVVTQRLFTNAVLISGVPKFDYKVSNAGDAATIYIAGFVDNV
jgi:hypothetical protein